MASAARQVHVFRRMITSSDASPNLLRHQATRLSPARRSRSAKTDSFREGIALGSNMTSSIQSLNSLQDGCLTRSRAGSLASLASQTSLSSLSWTLESNGLSSEQQPLASKSSSESNLNISIGKKIHDILPYQLHGVQWYSFFLSLKTDQTQTFLASPLQWAKVKTIKKGKIMGACSTYYLFGLLYYYYY